MVFYHDPGRLHALHVGGISLDVYCFSFLMLASHKVIRRWGVTREYQDYNGCYVGSKQLQA